MSSLSAIGFEPNSLLNDEFVLNPYSTVNDGIIDGFLIDFETHSIWENGEEQSGLNLYYLSDDDMPLKCFFPFDPYFYVDCESKYKANERTFSRLVRNINKADFSKHIKKVELVEVKDSEHPDHIFLPTSKVAKVTIDSPRNIVGREKIRDEILKVDGIVGAWREADINFKMRVSIDNEVNLKIGRHYKVFVRNSEVFKIREVPVDKFPDIPACSFDLETCKQPMKSPNPNSDPIGTIGVIFDYEGYILCNEDVINRIPKSFIMGTTEVKGETVLEWEDLDDDEERFRMTHDNCMVIRPVICGNEYVTILTFMKLIAERGSLGVVGYNSDNFDWTYVAQRLFIYEGKKGEKWNPRDKEDPMRRFGWRYDGYQRAYKLPGIINIDAYHYITQHSRLPKGSQGLKASTKKIFHFEPIDFEDAEMLMRSMDPTSEDYDPETVVYYNGSDIYCTQIFFKKLILPFFFSFTMDKPMDMFSISRRGNASICESGLLQRAYKKNILSPNKEDDGLKRGDVIEVDGKEFYVKSSSYKGAVVELASSGIYRSDWDLQIQIDPEGIDKIIEDVEEAIRMEIGDVDVLGVVEKEIVEGEVIENFIEKDFRNLIQMIRDDIRSIKENVKKVTRRNEDGVMETVWLYEGDLRILHADVSSLYPSIILNYKIQPHAVIDPSYCETCPFRETDPVCWCDIDWIRKIKYINADEEHKKLAYNLYKNRNLKEYADKLKRYEITKDDDKLDILQKIAKKEKKKSKEEIEITETARICQKAHGFFWKEVEQVRDDRYKYKYQWIEFDDKYRNEKKRYQSYIDSLKKKHGMEDADVYELTKQLSEAEERERNKILRKMQEYQSKSDFNQFVQAGKKAGLNSYYGYLESIGSRWRSIESAGTITGMGRNILLSNIRYTSCVSQLLEGDTDGYYILIPTVFPVNMTLRVRDKEGNVKDKKINVLSALLNYFSARKFTNHNSYDPKKCCDDVEPELNIEDGEKVLLCKNCGTEVEWINSPRCQIKWDTDGPYWGMFVQTKKKYVIWDENGEVAELKGLETKRNDAIVLHREIIQDLFDRYKDKETKSPKMAYEKGEEYIRGLIKRLKKREINPDRLIRNTGVSKKAMKRIDKAKHARERLKKHGISDFAYSYPDMQLIEIIAKYKAGNIDSYRMNAIVNSMMRSTDDPLFNVPIGVLQDLISAYSGGKGINKGVQFMAAYRDYDMGTEVDEYSTVTFVSSVYPQGTTYNTTASGKITTSKIDAGKSESMIPYALFFSDPETINHFIQRWMGNDPEIKEMKEAKKIINIDYYVDSIESLAYRLLVDPAREQGIALDIKDLFDKDLYGNKRMNEYFAKSSGKKTQGRSGRLGRIKKKPTKPSEKSIKDKLPIQRTKLNSIKKDNKEKDKKKGKGKNVKIDSFFS